MKSVLATGLVVVAALVVAQAALAASAGSGKGTSAGGAAAGSTTTGSAATGTTGRARVKRPAHASFGGTVVSVAPGTISVAVSRTGKNDSALSGQTVTVTVTSATAIAGKGASQASDIQTNDAVGVLASGDASTGFTAIRINDVTGVHNHWLAGTVSAISASSVTIAVAKTGPHDTPLAGQSTTLAIDGSTTVITGKGGSSVTIADVTAGETVGVLFTARGRNFTDGLTAVRIHVWHKTAPKSLHSEQPAPGKAPLPAGTTS
jgi:hypothetical protein